MQWLFTYFYIPYQPNKIGTIILCAGQCSSRICTNIMAPLEFNNFQRLHTYILRRERRMERKRKIPRTKGNEDGSFLLLLFVLLICRWWIGYLLRKVYVHNMRRRHPIISAHPGPKQRTDIICAATRPKQIPKKRYLLSKASGAYTVVACGSPQTAHAHTLDAFVSSGSGDVYTRKTKLPPILFSKPIISSRASDFVRVTARVM